jgi:hypothetical protein
MICKPKTIISLECGTGTVIVREKRRCGRGGRTVSKWVFKIRWAECRAVVNKVTNRRDHAKGRCCTQYFNSKELLRSTARGNLYYRCVECCFPYMYCYRTESMTLRCNCLSLFVCSAHCCWNCVVTKWEPRICCGLSRRWHTPVSDVWLAPLIN